MRPPRRSKTPPREVALLTRAPRRMPRSGGDAPSNPSPVAVTSRGDIITPWAPWRAKNESRCASLVAESFWESCD
jgi:hypothetical protein